MSQPLTQIVIFGASGDLTARKLVPALVNNAAEGAFPGPVQVVGIARSSIPTGAWRTNLAQWLDPAQLEQWERFQHRVHYLCADVLKDQDVAPMLERLDELCVEAGGDPETTGRLFYLALKPSLFAPVVGQLGKAGAIACSRGAQAGWRRVVVEKPFGTDLASARALNDELREHLREDQIYRIDHYLGKETVQNILTFRFQNAIFEPLWNSKHIESIEITVAEEVGMEGGRGAYYDEAGALRDMVQNHVMQILALVAMEPPNSMSAEAVRAEKIKLVQGLRRMTPEMVHEHVVRAQYVASERRERGYLEEEGVPADSKTETFVAIRAEINNWRWNGVPFFLRTGKTMNRRYSEVILRFRVPPVDLLTGPIDGEVCRLRPNTMRLLIQPEEGVRLAFLVKQPGTSDSMRSTVMRFDYEDLREGKSAPAYQRLLLDAIEGNATLFIHGDEVEASWDFVDAIRAGWSASESPVHTYPAGSMGPKVANELFQGCEGVWGNGARDS